MSQARYFEFKPYNLGRWIVWGAFALVLLVAPKVFNSNLSMTMLSQMGIAIIACLSYNMLLGQGGMLSFGHAVYTGLGSYMAIHALNAVSSGALPIPVSLVPVVGGIAGMGFAVLLGYVTTRKAGTPFAMITLGMAELVFAMSLMFSEFFGGEAGVSGNRVAGQPFFGITFGPQSQVYYLIAGYTFVCVALMYAFTAHAAGPHAECGARQPGACRVRRLQHPARALHRLHHRRLLCRHLGRPGGAQLRDRHGRGGGGRRARAPTCCSPSWVAPPSSSGRSSARS